MYWDHTKEIAQLFSEVHSKEGICPQWLLTEQAESCKSHILDLGTVRAQLLPSTFLS